MSRLFKGYMIITLLLILTASGCRERPLVITAMEEIEAQKDFDYATTRLVDISLTFSDYASLPVRLYAGSTISDETFLEEDPFAELSYLGTYILSEAGELAITSSLASRFDTIAILPQHIWLPNHIITSIAGDTVRYSYTETEDRSVNTAAARGVSESLDPPGYEENGFYYLSTFSSGGKPTIMSSDRMDRDNQILENISASLPEYRKVWDMSPEFLNDANIKIIEDDAEVTVTFLHEGAGFRNTLGYHAVTGDVSNILTEDIPDNLKIVIPNASYVAGGGELRSGNSISMGTIPNGTTLIWTLLPNNWDGSKNRDLSSDRYYSYSAWNPETINTSDSYDRRENVHTVVLLEEKPDEDDSSEPAKFIIGFEDLNRTPSSTDDDFNDLVFMVTVTPASAVEDLFDTTSPFAETNKAGQDTDGDTVPDIYDEYPQNLELASDASYSGFIAFEDQWPAKGDYDFNDLTAEYTYDLALNADNEIRSLTFSYTFVALGAGKRNGLGLHLPVDRTYLYTPADDDPVYINDEIELTEFPVSEDTQEIIMTISNNINDDFFSRPGYDSYIMINTSIVEDPPSSQVDPVSVTGRIYFTAESAIKRSELGNLPFDIFLIQGGNGSEDASGYEIHLPDYAPTDRMPEGQDDKFGTSDDASAPEDGNYFKTKNNLPWALHMPESWDYPLEEVTIIEAYPRFGYWAHSKGTTDKDWYTEDNAEAAFLYDTYVE